KERRVGCSSAATQTANCCFAMIRERAGGDGVRWRCGEIVAKWRHSRGGVSDRKRECTTLSALLLLVLDILQWLVFSPGIVGVSEHQPLGQWRVGVDPKGDERRRIRI